MTTTTQEVIPILFVPNFILVLYYNQWQKLWEYSVQYDPEFCPPYPFPEVEEELKRRGKLPENPF